jgi:hypothetical protein
MAAQCVDFDHSTLGGWTGALLDPIVERIGEMALSHARAPARSRQ